MRGTMTVVAFLVCGSGAARADSLVCRGGRNVETGLTIAQVRELCGAPTSSESKFVEARGRGEKGGSIRTGGTQVEVWRYDRGSGRQAAVLEFRDGKLFSIEYVEDR
jgi:hypothetical protein